MARASVDKTLAKIPLFKECTKKELQAVSRLVTPINVKAGKVLTKEGDAGREFMIIASGSATVKRKGRKIASLGPGDFFGELAALDWGAGFGYARSADVMATAPLRLLVLSPRELRSLMRAAPAVAEQIQAAARERLRRI